ncbi:uncharacterized protein LOC119740222 isoform X2 [Patiria miniata]|uniref:Kinesin-like protein KIF16B n=1 Tax=Patiria miniata TaxID=46514 RepID=A0A914B6F1_PATMI|nr:uncharacterized protein LOC119740222 isoform X2 [Patiria miniata]
MANVKVAVRVRPPSKKELDAGAINIIDVNEDVLSITNLKINSSEGDRHRERVKSYSFDHCYNSVDRQSDNYAPQELIYQDLGTEVLNASFSGYNACLFAYGQTGSGKTYTVMGDDANAGLIPRICEGMCSRVDDLEQGVTFKIEVSYLEIYNERVRDLLASSSDTNYTLKVREHPKDGPYVQDLTRHLVSDFNSVMMLIAQGNRNRTTAATHMHEASSRSHAIFTLNFVQAKMVNNMPSEIVSKINLVDLAGSERANLNYSKGRLQEGANINKSLVTLGNCISALAENSMALSAASMESLALSEDADFNSPKRRPGFIPYRNSVLTWLLKDSLGGNSRTIMIATISPSSTYFNETMSTLRYARRAKRIINQPLINEDPNVRLIRELRAEINRLKTLLNSASLSSSQASLVQDATISKMLAENEQKVDQLTEAWVDKWREAARIMQECNVGIRRESMGVIVESELPHLIGIDDDLLSTGIILYHLMEGQTTIGREDSETEQDIVLWGPGIECQHAVIVNHLGRVTLHPVNQSACAVNGNDIHEPTPLSQGAVVLLGKTNMFRFNHPAEAARLREKRASSIKPEDVEEIRRPRKNSVTLRVHNNLTAITEEGSRIRKISLSRETPPSSLDSPCAVPRGRSLDSSTSPIPEVSSIMMYNPGVELERQHKIKVDKVESTRKRLEELQDKERRTQAAHQKEEKRMKLAFEEHQQMIQEQRELLQRLREEHEKVKQETERELEEMRQRLAKEKEQGLKQLEEECKSLGTDQTRKASLLALGGDAVPHVIVQGTEPSSDLSVLDVDRKRLAQMELMQKQSQRKAEAVLERRLAAFDRQRSASLRLIEQEERRLHEIECIPSLSDRFASASNDSLDSSLRSEDETSNGIESRAVIGWGRVSPIGGRSDSDSASGKAASNSSDKEDNGIESPMTKTATPPPSVNRTGSVESLPHRTVKPISSKSQPSPPRPNKAPVATSPVKPKSTPNSVYSRLYQQQAPRFDYLRRKPHRPDVEDQSSRQGHVQGRGPSVRQRSLTDGSVDVNARSNRLNGKTTHSKSPRNENQASLTHNQTRDTLKTESKLRTKSLSPRRLPEKRPISTNSISPAARRKEDDGKESIHVPSARSRSKSPLKTQAPQRTVHNSKTQNSNPKPEIQSNTTGKQTSPARVKRTKTPSSESAIETAMKRKSAERHKNASKLSKEPVGSKGKSPAGTQDKAKANLPRIVKPISKAFEKLKPKATPHSDAFFVPLDEENDAKTGIDQIGQKPTHLNNHGDVVLENEKLSLDRQPAIGCSESMEDVVSIPQPPNPVSSYCPSICVTSDASLDDSFSRAVEEILSDTNESFSDSLEDADEQQPHAECCLDSVEDKHQPSESISNQNVDQSSRRRKRGVSVEAEDHHLIRYPEDGDTKLALQDSLEDISPEAPSTSTFLLRENRSEASPHSDERITSGYISDPSNDNYLERTGEGRDLNLSVLEDRPLESEESPQEASALNNAEGIEEIKSRPDDNGDLTLRKASLEMAVIDSGVSTDNNSVSSDHTMSGMDRTATPTVVDNNLDVLVQQEVDYKECVTPADSKRGHQTDNAADVSENAWVNPGVDGTKTDMILQLEENAVTNLAANGNLQEQSQIPQTDSEIVPAVSDIDTLIDNEAKGDTKEQREPEDVQILENPDKLSNPLPREPASVSTADTRSPLKTTRHRDGTPSIIETDSVPETFLLTECSSKIVTDGPVRKQNHTETIGETLPTDCATNELRKTKKSCPVAEPKRDVKHLKNTTSPSVLSNNKEGNESESPSSSGSPRKLVRSKGQSAVSPSPRKSRKKLKKRRTPIKSKSNRKREEQEREHFVSDDTYKGTPLSLSYLPLGASQVDTDERRSQSSPFSSSLSSSSAGTFASEFSRTDSLHSRSPDDEVALISDGVSDPPDLSDQPATPTDLIVKPLPSPKTLAESVFWASSSSASGLDEDAVLEDDVEGLVEPLEILEKELGQSSDLSIDYDDEDESGGEKMVESSDFTILADGQLDDTVEGNSTAVMPNSSREEPLLSLLDENYDKKGNSDNHLTMQPFQGANLRPEKENCLSPYTEREANPCSDATNNPQIIRQSEPLPPSFADKPTRFINTLNIEPLQMAHSSEEIKESEKSKSGKMPSSCASVHFGNGDVDPCVHLEASVQATSLPDIPQDVNKTTTPLYNIPVSLENVETETSSSIDDVRFLPRVDQLQMAEANMSSTDNTLEVLGHPQKTQTKSPGVVLVELREDMVPDGAIVESRADESQNLVLNRGKLVTEINPSLIQEELIRLRTLLNSITIAPFAFGLPELQSTPSDSKSELAALKAEEIPKGQESQGEGSVCSISPDSSTEELSIIEQLRGLSEKLGSSLPQEDTTEIMERARTISDHLEQTHSSVYSPSLVEELRELSKQLDASKFLTTEKYEEKAHPFDCKNQDDNEKSALFQSAQDLTLYQTAFEITQETLQPTPIGNLSLSPVQLQSTPVPRENNPLEFAGIDIKSPVVSPITCYSRFGQSASEDGKDEVFLENSESRGSTPDVNEVFHIDSESSDGEDSSGDEDGAMDTAERVLSEMSSFRQQLDILSGSDTLDDDDDDSSEGSNDESTKAANDPEEDQKTQEVLRKTRPSVGSRSSLECLLPTISEECLSSSDVDEPRIAPANVSPTENPPKKCYNFTPEDHTVRLEDPLDEVHADLRPCTSSVNEEIPSLNEPAIPIKFLRAVAKNLSEGQQEASILEEGSSQEGQSARSHLWEPENPVVAEPLLGKEFAATKAKLNMLVRILGGNWESLGETSSEGSAASSPVQGEFDIAPREQMPLTEDETNVSASDERIYSTVGNRYVVTYDESAQTDPITEQDLAGQMGQVHEELSSTIEPVDSACSLDQFSGAQVADKFTQTTLRQKVAVLATKDLSPLYQKTSVTALPTLCSETSSLPSRPQCQPSSDEDTDDIEDQPVSQQFSTHHSISTEQDQINSNRLSYQPDRLTDAPDAVPLKSAVSLPAELKTPKYDKKYEDGKGLNEVDQHYASKEGCKQDKDLEVDSLQPVFLLLPAEPIIKASVVLNNEVLRFPPCEEDESLLQKSGCVEPTVNTSKDEGKRLEQREVEKNSLLVKVPVELVRKTAVVPRDLNFMWPSETRKSLPKHTTRKAPQKSLLDSSKKTNEHKFRERQKQSSCSPVEEVMIGETIASKDVNLSSFTVDPKPGIADGDPLNGIPEIRLLGPVEEILVKEAVTLSDEPIMWPLTGTNPNENHHGQTCEPSDTTSLFQPIREESSSQNPSTENLLARDESASKAPVHGQQLEIQSEHSGGDTNLNELKELSTVMGLSPQRSYSTDEELIQIFSKGVAHFRSLKQDVIKPRLVAVATNTSPMKTTLNDAERVDAAVMTEGEIEQAHAYTSMSPNNEQELCLNQTTEIIPEQAMPLAQLTAAQLLGMIVDKPQDMIPQQTKVPNNDNTINTLEVTSSPHEIEAPSKTNLDHEPVLDSIDPEQPEQQTAVSTTPSYENATSTRPYVAQVPEKSKEVHRVHCQDSETEKPLKDESKSLDESRSSEDNRLGDDVIEFDDEEQRLLNELRKRTRASQEAAKRAMACALKLRQKNLSDLPMVENTKVTPDSLKQRSEPKVRPAIVKSQGGETKGRDSCQELLMQKEPEQTDSKASVPETLHPISEIANKECRFNVLPLEEFAQNVSRLMEDESDKDQISTPTKRISHARIILRQPSYEDGSTDSGNSSVLEVQSPVSHFENTEDKQLGPSNISQQPCHGVQDDDHDEVSISLDNNLQSRPQLITEHIQKEALCISDFDRLALKVSKLECFVPSVEPAKPKTTPSSEEKNPLKPLGSSRFFSQSPDQQHIDLSSLEFQPQETDRDDVHTRPFIQNLLNKPGNDVELLLPSELAHEKSNCSHTSDDIEEKLAKLTESSHAENESTGNRSEIGAKKDDKTRVSDQKLIQPEDVANNGSCERPEDFTGRDSLKSHRPLLGYFSDISFDLDNDNDEDLRALKRTNENIDRIIAETSSLESDFEDDTEPELAELVDDETDTFTPQRSSVDGLASFRISLQEKPLKANSAPAALAPKEADDSNNESEGEEEEISSLRLHGILISPEKLEWLLADSESGESSSTSSPREENDSSKMHNGEDEGPKPTRETPVNDNRSSGSGNFLETNSEPESRDGNTHKQPGTSNEELSGLKRDQHSMEFENQQRLAKVFEYEAPATKQGIFLPEMKSIFVVTKDEQPHQAGSSDPLPLANSLHVKDNKLKPEIHESQELNEEIQRLKSGHGSSLEKSVDLEAYPLVNRQKDFKKHAQEGPDDDSNSILDTLNTNLTQSSGVFSSSTRDTELSWLRERRLSSEQLSSTSSETEDADFSRIQKEYRNILEDCQESTLNPPESTQSTPTNVFTQTDDESPMSSNDESSFGKENMRLGASWPLREPISTKLHPRRDIAVELMEASLMHGIGETDAFLKFLDSDLPLEKWKSSEVTLRHRRSQSVGPPLKLDGEASRHDPSPSKQKPRQVKVVSSQPTNLRSEPKGQGSSPITSPEIPAESPTSLSPSQNALPSERRRFLQQLRSNIVSATSTQRPERAKIDALLQDSWMGKEPSRSTDSDQEKKPRHINAPNPNRDDIEALLEESRHMRERSRAEIAKAEENLSHARPVSRQGGKGGKDSFRERLGEGFPPANQGSLTRVDGISLGARPKSAETALSRKERVGTQDGSEDSTDNLQGSLDYTMRQRRPHSAHGSLDLYNCQDAIDREIQCLRAASAAMSSRPPNLARPDIPSRRPQTLTHTNTKPSPPPPQRYLPPYDHGASRYAESPRQGQGTASSQTRSQSPLAVPIIAFHPPSPEEIDPSSIPTIARANEVLQASYRSPGSLRSQVGVPVASLPQSEASLTDLEMLPSLVRGGARMDVPRTQASLKNSGRASHDQSRIFQTTSPSPKLSSSHSSHPSPPKRRVRLDSPDAPVVKEDAGSPPRRSGRQSRLSSQERMTPELPPIIETPLVSLDSLYELAADQAMAILIRETTLTGKVDPNKSKQPIESNAWRYQGQEKGILFWQKTNKYCPIDSFLGLGVLKAPAQTVFNLINNSSRYDCLHEAITNVKLLHKIDNTMKVLSILCDMDNCSLQKPRDFCCVIKQTHWNDRWYIVATSVKHPSYPAVSTTVRGQILCCGVSMEPVFTEDGEHCRIAHLSQIDLQGDLKPTLVNHLTSRLPLCLAHLRDCIEIGQL